MSTWPDGAAVDTFLADRGGPAWRPSTGIGDGDVAGAATAGLLEPVAEVEVEFDNASLPWHTLCIATGRDRPGTLSTIAAALSAASVVVHERVTTIDGRLADRFALTEPLAQARRPMTANTDGASRAPRTSLAQRNTAATRLMHAGNADLL